MDVRISVEAARGCGYRSAGKTGVGIYLVGTWAGEPCERLPFVLEQCPCCGGGIKPSRGFTWVDPAKLFAADLGKPCDPTVPDHGHAYCPVCHPEVAAPRAGLIWVGQDHYPTPHEFIVEAKEMGISRKLSGIPRGFEVGKQWVYLCHRRALAEIVPGKNGNSQQEVEYRPGAFFAWKPTKVELVIDDPQKVPERALRVAERIGEEHVELVKVVRDIDAQQILDLLFDEEE